MARLKLFCPDPSQLLEIQAFIDDLGLIPTCLITPSLAREYAKELTRRNIQSHEDRFCSELERDIINDALKAMSMRNNNRLHIWRKADDLYPQLSFENFD